MLLSTLSFALMNIAVKMLPRIPVFELVFFRALVTLAMSAIVIKQAGIPFFGNNKLLLISRGVFGSISLLLYFVTVQEIPLASAVTIQYLSPIFSTFLAIYVLHQPMQPFKWVFFAISFAGVTMVKGFDDRISTLMLLCGIGSAVFSALGYNTIGKLKGQDDPRVIIMYFPLVTLPLITIPTITNWVTPDWKELLLLLAMGIFTQLGQLYMTWAYHTENIGRVAIFQYLGIVYALLLGYFVFDESFTFQSIAGMGLVVAGVVLSVAYTFWEKRKAATVQE